MNRVVGEEEQALALVNVQCRPRAITTRRIREVDHLRLNDSEVDRARQVGNEVAAAIMVPDLDAPSE